MKKIIVAMAAVCLLSLASSANGGKHKRNKQAVKKEQKATKADCPVTCPMTGCNRS